MNKETKEMYALLRRFEVMPLSLAKMEVGRKICRYFGVADHVSPTAVISFVDDEWIVQNFSIHIKGADHRYGIVRLDDDTDFHLDCYRKGPFCLYRTMSTWVVLDKYANLSFDESTGIQIDETGKRVSP